MSQKSAAKLANERIVAILSHSEASGREELALHIATKTSMSLQEAVTTMKAAGRLPGAHDYRLDVAGILANRQQNVTDARGGGHAPARALIDPMRHMPARP